MRASNLEKTALEQPDKVPRQGPVVRRCVIVGGVTKYVTQTLRSCIEAASMITSKGRHVDSSLCYISSATGHTTVLGTMDTKVGVT